MNYQKSIKNTTKIPNEESQSKNKTKDRLEDLVGFWQEFQAANAVDALKKQLALKARVKRDGKWIEWRRRQAKQPTRAHLIYINLFLAAILILVMIFRGSGILTLVQFALILLVAAIPVALPAVLSVTMAIGAAGLAKLKAFANSAGRYLDDSSDCGSHRWFRHSGHLRSL